MLVGGEGHPQGFDAGYFVKPTVFVNISYDSEDEAIRIANDSQYGLHAAVLGADVECARRVASQIRAGRVAIKNMTDDPQAPWGVSNTRAPAVNMAVSEARRFSKPGLSSGSRNSCQATPYQRTPNHG